MKPTDFDHINFLQIVKEEDRRIGTDPTEQLLRDVIGYDFMRNCMRDAVIADREYRNKKLSRIYNPKKKLSRILTKK